MSPMILERPKMVFASCGYAEKRNCNYILPYKVSGRPISLTPKTQILKRIHWQVRIDNKHTKSQSYTYNDDPFTLWTNIRSADLKAIQNNIIVHPSPFKLQASDINLKEQKLVGELRQIIGLDVN